jgi:hypothetical protein
MKFWFALFFLICAAAFGQAPVAEDVPVKDTAAQAHISAAEEDQVFALLEEDTDGEWDPERASELRYKRVSLSDAPNDGIIVQSTSLNDCGATGNCPIWVLRETNAAVQLVLGNAVGDAIGLQTEKEQGLKNILLSSNQSAKSNFVAVFVFDGQKYSQRSCYEEKLDQDGKRRTLQPVNCNSTSHP